MKKLDRYRIDGPFGDCTSAYKIYFPEGITVEEFINFVLEENPGEWGSFILGSCFSGEILGRYNRNQENRFKINNLEYYNKIKDFHPIEVEACGGWSLMDYMIYTKENYTTILTRPKNKKSNKEQIEFWDF